MKHVVLMLVVLISSIGISGAQDQRKELKGKVKVEVDGLSCPFCAYGLEKKLKDMKGISKIEIDVENAFALLTIQEGETVSEETVRENVKRAGFTARQITEVKKDGKDQ